MTIRPMLMLIATLTGCAHVPAAVIPTAIRTEIEHVSHPLVGWPISARNNEDALSTVNVVARWTRGSFYVENGLGYKLKDSGFYGPDLTYVGRIGYEWRLQ